MPRTATRSSPIIVLGVLSLILWTLFLIVTVKIRPAAAAGGQ